MYKIRFDRPSWRKVEKIITMATATSAMIAYAGVL